MLCNDSSCRTIAQINDLHFLKRRVFTKTLTGLHMRVDCASTEL